MHLIKSTTGQTILFDDGEMLILNSPHITREQRLFTAVFLILIASAGIIMNLSGEPLFSLIAFAFLLVYGVGYFFIYFIFNKKDPAQIQYGEIDGIEVKLTSKSAVLSVNYNNKSRYYRIKTNQLNPDLIKFLERKNLLKYEHGLIYEG
jgi:hypothetical protein